MLNRSWAESNSQKATLPEDSPETFKLFLGRIYQGKLEVSPLEGGVERCIRLSGFAEKHDITALLDAAIETIMGLMKGANSLLGPNMMGFAYAATHVGSKLRLLAARCFVFATLHLSQELANGAWSKEKRNETITKHNDLWIDAFDMMRLQAGKLQLNPRDQPLCDYDQHAKTEACPYLK